MEGGFPSLSLSLAETFEFNKDCTYSRQQHLFAVCNLSENCAHVSVGVDYEGCGSPLTRYKNNDLPRGHSRKHGTIRNGHYLDGQNTQCSVLHCRRTETENRVSIVYFRNSIFLLKC